MMIRTLSDLNLDRFILDKRTLDKKILDMPPFGLDSKGIDQYTKLMLHFNGANGSTVFLDSSLSPKTVTQYGNAQISTAQSVFGGASGLFGGAGSYITLPDSTDWNFVNGDFTVDMRIRLNDVTSLQRILGQTEAANRYWSFNSGKDGVGQYLEIGMTDTSGYKGHAYGYTNLNTNTWYHIAFVRHNSVFLIFVNGVSIPVTTATPLSSMGDVNSCLYIGQRGSGIEYLNGYIDELRISSIARWASNFTPPTQEYAA